MEEEVAIANPRAKERSENAVREETQRAAGLNAFVFAFTSARLAGNTAVRPNCHRATSVPADSSEITS